MTASKTLAKAELDRFTRSENWYRHSLNRKVLFTEGAKYVADHGCAYWLQGVEEYWGYRRGLRPADPLGPED